MCDGETSFSGSHARAESWKGGQQRERWPLCGSSSAAERDAHQHSGILAQLFYCRKNNIGNEFCSWNHSASTTLLGPRSPRARHATTHAQRVQQGCTERTRHPTLAWETARGVQRQYCCQVAPTVQLLVALLRVDPARQHACAACTSERPPHPWLTSGISLPLM